MSRPKPKYDAKRVKYSKRQQWQERAYSPVATEHMSRDEILKHRENLLVMYECDEKDLTYEFIKIRDEDDEDRDDCLWLVYYLQCVVSGVPTKKVVFTIKVPIPEEIRKMAEEKRKQDLTRSRVKLLRGPEQFSSGNDNTTNDATDPPRILTEGVARPKLRRPNVPKK